MAKVSILGRYGSGVLSKFNKSTDAKTSELEKDDNSAIKQSVRKKLVAEGVGLNRVKSQVMGEINGFKDKTVDVKPNSSMPSGATLNPNGVGVGDFNGTTQNTLLKSAAKPISDTKKLNVTLLSKLETQHKSLLESLTKSNSSLEKISQFQLSTQSNFYKASLDVQTKMLGELESIKNALYTGFNINPKTGEKEKQEEEKQKDSLIRRLMFSQGRSGVTEALGEILANTKNKAISKAQAAIPYADVIDLIASLDKADIGKMVTSQIKAMALGQARKGIGKVAGKDIAEFMSDPDTFLSRKVSRGNNAIWRVLGDILGIKIDSKQFGGASLSYHAQQIKENKSERATFDGNVYTSITKLIPGLLSEQLAAMTGSQARVYDYQNDKWVTKDEAAKHMKDFHLSSEVQSAKASIKKSYHVRFNAGTQKQEGGLLKILLDTIDTSKLKNVSKVDIENVTKLQEKYKKKTAGVDSFIRIVNDVLVGIMINERLLDAENPEEIEKKDLRTRIVSTLTEMASNNNVLNKIVADAYSEYIQGNPEDISRFSTIAGVIRSIIRCLGELDSFKEFDNIAKTVRETLSDELISNVASNNKTNFSTTVWDDYDYSKVGGGSGRRGGSSKITKLRDSNSILFNKSEVEQMANTVAKALRHMPGDWRALGYPIIVPGKNGKNNYYCYFYIANKGSNEFITIAVQKTDAKDDKMTTGKRAINLIADGDLIEHLQKGIPANADGYAYVVKKLLDFKATYKDEWDATFKTLFDNSNDGSDSNIKTNIVTDGHDYIPDIEDILKQKSFKTQGDEYKKERVKSKIENAMNAYFGPALALVFKIYKEEETKNPPKDGESPKNYIQKIQNKVKERIKANPSRFTQLPQNKIDEILKIVSEDKIDSMTALYMDGSNKTFNNKIDELNSESEDGTNVLAGNIFDMGAKLISSEGLVKGMAAFLNDKYRGVGNEKIVRTALGMSGALISAASGDSKMMALLKGGYGVMLMRNATELSDFMAAHDDEKHKGKYQSEVELEQAKAEKDLLYRLSAFTTGSAIGRSVQNWMKSKIRFGGPLGFVSNLVISSVMMSPIGKSIMRGGAKLIGKIAKKIIGVDIINGGIEDLEERVKKEKADGSGTKFEPKKEKGNDKSFEDILSGSASGGGSSNKGIPGEYTGRQNYEKLSKSACAGESLAAILRDLAGSTNSLLKDIDFMAFSGTLQSYMTENGVDIGFFDAAISNQLGAFVTTGNTVLTHGNGLVLAAQSGDIFKNNNNTYIILLISTDLPNGHGGFANHYIVWTKKGNRHYIYDGKVEQNYKFRNYGKDKINAMLQKVIAYKIVTGNIDFKKAIIGTATGKSSDTFTSLHGIPGSSVFTTKGFESNGIPFATPGVYNGKPIGTGGTVDGQSVGGFNPLQNYIYSTSDGAQFTRIIGEIATKYGDPEVRKQAKVLKDLTQKIQSDDKEKNGDKNSGPYNKDDSYEDMINKFNGKPGLFKRAWNFISSIPWLAPVTGALSVAGKILGTAISWGGKALGFGLTTLMAGATTYLTYKGAQKVGSWGTKALGDIPTWLAEKTGLISHKHAKSMYNAVGKAAEYQSTLMGIKTAGAAVDATLTGAANTTGLIGEYIANGAAKDTAEIFSKKAGMGIAKDIAKEAGEKSVSSIFGGIGSKLTSPLQKLFASLGAKVASWQWMHKILGGKMLGSICKTIEESLIKLAEKPVVGRLLVTKSLKKATQTASSAIGAIPVIGTAISLLITGGFLVWGFFSGWRNAYKYFDEPANKYCTWGQKLAAGVGKAILEAIPALPGLGFVASIFLSIGSALVEAWVIKALYGLFSGAWIEELFTSGGRFNPENYSSRMERANAQLQYRYKKAESNEDIAESFSDGSDYVTKDRETRINNAAVTPSLSPGSKTNSTNTNDKKSNTGGNGYWALGGGYAPGGVITEAGGDPGMPSFISQKDFSNINLGGVSAVFNGCALACAKMVSDFYNKGIPDTQLISKATKFLLKNKSISSDYFSLLNGMIIQPNHWFAKLNSNNEGMMVVLVDVRGSNHWVVIYKKGGKYYIGDPMKHAWSPVSRADVSRLQVKHARAFNYTKGMNMNAGASLMGGSGIWDSIKGMASSAWGAVKSAWHSITGNNAALAESENNGTNSANRIKGFQSQISTSIGAKDVNAALNGDDTGGSYDPASISSLLNDSPIPNIGGMDGIMDFVMNHLENVDPSGKIHFDTTRGHWAALGILASQKDVDATKPGSRDRELLSKYRELALYVSKNPKDMDANKRLRALAKQIYYERYWVPMHLSDIKGNPALQAGLFNAMFGGWRSQLVADAVRKSFASGAYSGKYTLPSYSNGPDLSAKLAAINNTMTSEKDKKLLADAVFRGTETWYRQINNRGGFAGNEGNGYNSRMNKLRAQFNLGQSTMFGGAAGTIVIVKKLATTLLSKLKNITKIASVLCGPYALGTLILATGSTAMDNYLDFVKKLVSSGSMSNGMGDDLLFKLGFTPMHLANAKDKANATNLLVTGQASKILSKDRVYMINCSKNNEKHWFGVMCVQDKFYFFDSGAKMVVSEKLENNVHIYGIYENEANELAESFGAIAGMGIRTTGGAVPIDNGIIDLQIKKATYDNSALRAVRNTPTRNITTSSTSKVATPNNNKTSDADLIRLLQAQLQATQEQTANILSILNKIYDSSENIRKESKDNIKHLTKNNNTQNNIQLPNNLEEKKVNPVYSNLSKISEDWLNKPMPN